MAMMCLSLTILSVQSREKLLRTDTVFQHALLAHSSSHYGANKQLRHICTVEKSVCYSLQSSLVKHTVCMFKKSIKASASQRSTFTVKYGRLL